MIINYNKWLLFLFIISLYSCNSKTKQDLNGFWTSKEVMFEIRTDTIVVYPYCWKYVFEIKHKNIVLKKCIEEARKFDLPYTFGSIINKDSTCEILSSLYKNRTFKMLRFKGTKQELSKIQFSTGGMHQNVDLEIDTSGISFVTKQNSFGNLQTDSFKMSNVEIKRIFLLASLVKFDSLKPEYFEYCCDVPRFGFVFFLKDKTPSTFISCVTELESLVPLRQYLDNYTFTIFRNDHIGYKKAKNKFYESKLTLARSVLDSIEYLSLFDSVNNRPPIYNEQKLKMLFKKYYKFKDTLISCQINLDQSGYIVNLKFNGHIEVTKELLYDVKKIKPIRAALYKGFKIPVSYFDCINFE